MWKKGDRKMAQIYQMISLGAFFLAIICFMVALVCWFKFNIPKIIGDLSGRTAQKSIAQMRAHNEMTGKKTFQAKKITTDSITRNTTQLDCTEETSLLSEGTQVLAQPEHEILYMLEDIKIIHTEEVI